MRFFLCLGLLGILGFVQAQDEQSQAVVYSTQQSYEQVKENLEFAITNQGLLIRGIMKIGEMLDNTRQDLGYEPVLLQGDAFDFCSALHTYAMIATDPRNIVNCPFTVVAYVTLEQPDTVYVAYRVPQLLGDESGQVRADIAKLLETIARDTVFE